MIHAASEEAAVNGQNMAGDVTRGVRSKEHGGAGELLQFAEAAHGCPGEKLLAAFRAVGEGGVEFGAENAGCDGVDADTFAGPLDGERFCKRSDGGLAGAVSGDFVKCDEARERRNINDAPVAALEHVTADDAASAK